MYKDKEKEKKYFKSYRRKQYQRWHQIGACIDCGLPTGINLNTNKPFWRCKEHRLKVSKNNKNYYSNNVTKIRTHRKVVSISQQQSKRK